MNAYDILAIRPITEQAFQNACLTMDIPIISLDLTQHFPFHFRPKPCMAAVNRGVRFEVCYAQVLNADTRGRSNFISNFTSLCRATRGRGIILSSEARGPLGLRGPADAVNLLSVWGLANEKGMEGLRALPRSIVVNEGVKRNGFRGIVDVVQTARKPAGEQEAESRGDTPMSDQSGKKQQKRKPGEDEAPQISKRQAKKMKLAARQSAATSAATKS
jgi:ribonuclease P/MRP protein subunit RPP1